MINLNTNNLHIGLDQSNSEAAMRQRINEHRLSILEDIRFSKANNEKISLARLKQQVSNEFNSFLEKTEKQKRQRLREQQMKQKPSH